MRDECHKWMVSLSKAWTLVGHELKNHGKLIISKLLLLNSNYVYTGRLPVPESVFPQSICGSTLLKYLVPTTTGAGVCTTSLVDFLVGIHNEFVERCHNAMPARSDERSVVNLGSSISSKDIYIGAVKISISCSAPFP